MPSFGIARMDNGKKEVILFMTSKECDFECEGPDCNCETFYMRKADQNRATFFYVACVWLLVGAAVFVVLASIINDKLWDLILIFVSVVDFILFFLIFSNLPEEYDITCTEYKVYFRDIGIPRLKRKYVFAIDVLIAAVPIMIFVWDIFHTVVAIQSGVLSDDEVLFMYFWYLPDWTLRAQGVFDAIVLSLGLFLFVIEVVIWFTMRQGNLCSAYFDDIPVAGINEMERRFQELETNYWEDINRKNKENWEKTKQSFSNAFKGKNRNDGINGEGI